MKNFKIVLITVCTLISTGTFAQNNKSISKKEQMKMEVVKMKTNPGKISNKVSASNRSAKEQMKSDLMKAPGNEQSHELVVDNSQYCSNLQTRSDLSPKEQMKLKEMNQNNKCMMVGDSVAVENGKCKNCGKKATTVKK